MLDLRLDLKLKLRIWTKVGSVLDPDTILEWGFIGELRPNNFKSGHREKIELNGEYLE